LFLLLAGGYFALQDNRVQTYLTQKIAAQLSKQLNSKITVGKVNIAFFKKIVLEDVLVEGQKSDTLFFTNHLSAKIDTLKIRHKKISISELVLHNNVINIERDSASHYNFSFLANAFKGKKDTSQIWQISCNHFGFSNSNFTFNDLSAQENVSINVNNINFEISDFGLLSDSLFFKIKELNLDDGKNLFLKNLSAEVSFFQKKTEVKNVSFETLKSSVRNTEIELNFENIENRSLTEAEFDIRLSESEISFSEMAELIPSLKGMDLKLNISGQVYGTVNDLQGKNIVLKTGQNTSAFLDFYINDITDVENMYLFVDLLNSQTTFNDLSQIHLPHIANVEFLSFPASFYQMGRINYKGNFTGFLTDFVTFGTFTTRMGTLKTDLSVVPETEGKIKYKGNLATNKFRLGEFFKAENIGMATFNGNIDGNYDKLKQTFSGKFRGVISEIEAFDYLYTNIIFDGNLDKKMFDGVLSIDDPNLNLNFTGQVNFNPEIPVFDFNLHLNKALPGQLNLIKHFQESEMAFNVTANFTGDKLDNLEGTIKIDDGVYQNQYGKFDLHGMELSSMHSLNADILSFTSDYFDVEIMGSYHFQNLLNTLRKSVNYYLPAINYKELINDKENIFEYQLNVKNLDTLTAIFMPDIKIESPFIVYGRIDSEKTIFTLEGSIPGFSTHEVLVKDIFIGNKPQNEEYTSKFRLGEVLLNNGMLFKNVNIDSKIAKNIVENQITWTNNETDSYSGSVKTRSVFTFNNATNHPYIEIEGFPSHIYIADSLWEISPFTASVDTTSIVINNFRFFNKEQQITFDGKISEDKSDILSAKIENISLEKIQTLFDTNFKISGIMNGSAGIFDFYEQKMIISDIGIKDFTFKGQKIGDISLSNYWNNFESLLNSELVIKNDGKESLRGEGTFYPANRELDYDFKLDSLSIVILETVLQGSFSDIRGTATGRMKIHGSPDHILLNGALFGANAGLTINYTQVAYNFSDSVYFKGDTLLFRNIAIQDAQRNRGTFNGYIVHHNFNNMIYNLSMSSPKILALNTALKDNPQFFGQVYANGRFEITGRGKTVRLTGTGTTLPETNVNISLEYESDIKQYDFIQFITAEESEKQEFTFPAKKDDGDFSMNLTIMATPDARAQLIYNSQIGDVIRAQGEGILLFGMDKEGNITLSGNYTVERGDYLFTLQNVINKRFNIEKGGTIIWSGDPYNASININAVYNLKASLYGLLPYENIYQNQRIPVDCKIKLSENLSNPNIQFEIDFPTAEEWIIDVSRQYFNNEEDLNKQILSLLVLGKFYTPEYLRGTYEAQNSNVFGTTASELVSNQLSNWLSQISNLVDFGVNYRPGNQITNDEIELALSTQIFDDRVTINGNIGNNVNPNTTNNSQLVGDFDINVKLIPSGKIQFKAYNRSNNNLIYETSPYTQGIGLSFQEEYNTLQELHKKMTTLFRKKEKMSIESFDD
jgi:hypothetical protein